MSGSPDILDPAWVPIRLRGAVYLEKDGKVLLVYDPVYRGGCWTLPGGGVEFEEGIIDAAEREVLEETGLTIRVHSLWGMREVWEPETDYPDSRDPVRRSLELVFIGDVVSGEINIENNPSRKRDGIRRVQDCRWVPLEGLGISIDGTPIYAAVPLSEERPVEVKGVSLKKLAFLRLDLRRGD